MSACDFSLEIQDLLDDRLEENHRAQLEAHLTTCDACQHELAVLRWVKESVRGSAAELPPDLARRIGAALDEQDGAMAATPRHLPRIRLRVWHAAVAAAVVVALASLVPLVRNTYRTDIAAVVVSDLERYRAGDLQLALTTAGTVELERFFSASGAPSRVFDLGMMKYRVVGGLVHVLEGRPTALFVYQHESGQILLCEMYAGDPGDLPPPKSVRSHDGIEFRVYERNGISLVFWPEGGVMCVLVGSLPTEDLVQLAFAKAQAS